MSAILPKGHPQLHPVGATDHYDDAPLTFTETERFALGVLRDHQADMQQRLMRFNQQMAEEGAMIDAKERMILADVRARLGLDADAVLDMSLETGVVIVHPALSAEKE